MPDESPATGPTRRDLLLTGVAGSATATMLAPARASDEAVELIERLTGKTPTESDRLHLVMPRTFPNGYTVPLSIEVDSPMTENDHVRHVRVRGAAQSAHRGRKLSLSPTAKPTPRVDAHPPCRAAIRPGCCRDERWRAVDDQDLGRGRHERLRLTVIGVRQKMVAPMPRVQVPSAATKGEIFQVKALISHQMETGLRRR